MALYSDTYSDFNYRIILCFLLAASILFCCPLLGMILKGISMDRFLEFPPVTGYVSHAPNNELIFWAGLVISCSLLCPVLLRFFRALKASRVLGPSSSFPKWGFGALLLMLVAWASSWGLLPLPKWIRMWSFTPLWVGFIVFVNALTTWRLGTCLLLRRPEAFVGLFLLSCVFWWYFEFLNRFVQNWYYMGVSELGPVRYSVMASLAFSTVLPAVMSVNELLKSTRAFEDAFNFKKDKRKVPRPLAAGILAISALSLSLIGVYPDILFPIVWISPLFVICSLKVLLWLPNLMDFAAQKEFGPLVRLSTSGLICGFFWEMWNYLSYPKWLYSIPFVGQCKVFEMPILGYMGYLPFGLECAAVSSLLIPLWDICSQGPSGIGQGTGKGESTKV